MGCHRGYHQGHQQTIATGNLSDQEHSCQRRIHDTRHHPGHTCQYKITDRNRDHSGHIDQVSNQESGNSPSEQTGSENTSNPPTTVGESCSYYLDKYQTDHIQNNDECIVPEIEKIGIVQQCICIIGQQSFQRRVSFTVERRKNINQQAQ